MVLAVQGGRTEEQELGIVFPQTLSQRDGVGQEWSRQMSKTWASPDTLLHKCGFCGATKTTKVYFLGGHDRTISLWIRAELEGLATWELEMLRSVLPELLDDIGSLQCTCPHSAGELPVNETEKRYKLILAIEDLM